MYPQISNPQDYKAALYLRLSKEDENMKENSESIRNQKILLEEYARNEKLKVYDIYIDDGYSGTNFKRPGFERMIEDVEEKKINMIITKDMSRLGRDYIDTGKYMERYFPEKGVRYISLLDGIDTGADGYNNDITPFKALINDMYAKDISKKVTSVKRNQQEKGLFIGGKAPYGYKKSAGRKNTIEIDEAAAENVRYIFNLAMDGKSCREIALRLNEQNIPSPAVYAGINISVKGPYSGLWSGERISYMLQNEVYTGKMVQGRSRKVSYKSNKSRNLPREEWIIKEGTHEPIVDEETFHKVGLLINVRKKTRHRKHDYLLKGLVYCHECGYPLGIIRRELSENRPVLYFICRTYQRFTKYKTCTCHCVRVETVTGIILSVVKEICRQYINYLDLEYIINTVNQKITSERKQRNRGSMNRKADLLRIQSHIDKAYGDRLSNVICEEDFRRIYEKLKEEQAVLQTKEKISGGSGQDIILDDIQVKELINKFMDTKECSRELLVSLIERIELTEDKKLYIYYHCKQLDGQSRLS